LLVGLRTPKKRIHTFGPTLFLEYNVLSNHTVCITLFYTTLFVYRVYLSHHLGFYLMGGE